VECALNDLAKEICMFCCEILCLGGKNVILQARDALSSNLLKDCSLPHRDGEGIGENKPK